MNIAFVTPPGEGNTVLVADLLHGCWCHGRRVGGLRLPPLPQMILATIARGAGHRCRVFDAPGEGIDTARLLGGLRGYDLAVFHVSSASYASDRKFITALRERYPGVQVCVYGAHPTFRPEAFDDGALYDHVIPYRPEDGFGRLVARGEPPHLDSMEDLPVTDYSLLPKKARYFNPIGGRFHFATMVTSRGCPGGCTFCTVPAFYGTKYDAMSAERVFREVRYLRKRGYREIFFRDENFTTSRDRVAEICDLFIREKAGVEFIVSSRVDSVDAELLNLLKRAGCRYIRYGVESGSDALLARVGKGTSREVITGTFRLTADAGIKTHAHLIAGLPGEGEEDVASTIDLVRTIRPDTITIGLFTPLPGAKLYRKTAGTEEGGEIEASQLHLRAWGPPSMSEEERTRLEKIPSLIYRDYYLRPSYILRSLFGTRSVEEFLIKIASGANVFLFSLGK